MKTKLTQSGLAQKLAREQTVPEKRSDGVVELYSTCRQPIICCQ
jgi:hypothetical protein